VAIFLAPTMFGLAFPGRQLVAVLPIAIPLVALGLRRLPRTGAVLALIGVAASTWIWLHARLAPDGGLVGDGLPDAPFGPLHALLPEFDHMNAYAVGFSAALVAALAAPVAIAEWRRTHRAPAD